MKNSTGNSKSSTFERCWYVLDKISVFSMKTGILPNKEIEGTFLVGDEAKPLKPSPPRRKKLFHYCIDCRMNLDSLPKLAEHRSVVQLKGEFGVKIGEKGCYEGTRQGKLANL